jgi:hypothetical protein
MSIYVPSLDQEETTSRVPAFIRRAWQLNSPLTLFVLTMALVTILATVGITVDDRLVVGAPVWAKTTKFAISFVDYGSTLLWLFSYIKNRTRFIRFFLNATAFILYLEMAILITQAVRGRMMHFNYTTFIDGTLYTVMAASIFSLWAISMVTAFLMLRQELPGKAFAWSIRLGLILSIAAGFGVGNLMTSPTAQQLELMQTGAANAGQIIGAHTVGAEDGGPGLPLLGWSTTHGDLRIPHFFGLHALQIVPLLGWFLARRREAWLSENHKLALVISGALGYLGFLGLVTWQALRGQSIVAPDTLTITTAALFISLVITLVGSIVGHAYVTGRTIQATITSA